MARSHGKGEVSINLVPMIDLLTVLVFFLLVNAGDVVTAPTTKSLKLPTSSASTAPKLTPNIQVTNQDIVVDGRLIAKVPDVLASTERIIPELVEEMRYQAERTRTANSKNTAHGEVTILADEKISYALIKKIMVSCTVADYGKVSLAVVTKAAKAE